LTGASAITAAARISNIKGFGLFAVEGVEVVGASLPG
jgi:hypothetical protein